jgi:hypothetical protein
VKEKPITVYLANGISPDNADIDWSFLYPRPQNMFSTLIKEKSDNVDKNSFFTCPAFSNLTKNTIQYFSPMNASYHYDFTNEEDPYFVPTSKEFIDVTISRPPALAYGNTAQFELRYMMFADEPLDVLFTSPHFSKPEYIKYGTTIPGKFNIGQWFRPYVFEVQLWSDKGEFHLKENEPLFYAHFETDREVIFKHFELSRRLVMMVEACVDTTTAFGKGQSLLSRYKRFKSIGMREKIITEIEKNIINDK